MAPIVVMSTGGDLTEAERVRFQRLMLPHLDAAYALAHWLTRHDDEARDAVQEAYLRASDSSARSAARTAGAGC